MTRGSLRSRQSSWPWPDVERDTRAAPRRKQHVGEAAGRRADVERLAVPDGDAEGVERVRELEAAAADVRMIGRRRARRRVGGDRRARPSTPPGRRPCTWPGEDERARALARRREAAVDEQQRRGARFGSFSVRCSSRRRQCVPVARPSAAIVGRRPTPSARAAERRRARVARAPARGERGATRSSPIERRVGRLAGGGVLAGGLAELARRRPRRRGCRRRSGTRARARRRTRSMAPTASSVRAGHDGAGDRRRADERAGLARVHRRAGRRRRASSARRPARLAGGLRDRAPGRRPCRSRRPPSAMTRDRAQLARASTAGSSARPARARAARTPRSAGRRRPGSAMPSPYTTCSVGRPRRSVSLSIAGRSSWIERVGVDQLDRARGRQRQRARVGAVVGGRGRGARDGVGGGERQDRAQALAAGEQAVAHRLADERRAGGRRGQEPVERRVDARARRASRNVGERRRRHGRSLALVARRATRRRARGRRLQLAALVEDLDAALGLLEPRVAEARQLHAALVQLERLSRAAGRPPRAS